MTYKPSTEQQRTAEQDFRNFNRFFIHNNELHRHGLPILSRTAYWHRKLSATAKAAR